MAQTKLIVWLMYGIGIPVYAFTMYINITNWKSDVLFFLSLVLVGLKAYHDIQRNKREERKSILENKLKEIEILEREQELKIKKRIK